MENALKLEKVCRLGMNVGVPSLLVVRAKWTSESTDHWPQMLYQNH